MVPRNSKTRFKYPVYKRFPFEAGQGVAFKINYVREKTSTSRIFKDAIQISSLQEVLVT